MVKTIIKLYFQISLTLICIRHSVSVEFVPPNRTIEAIQNDRYVFGIEDDGEIEIAKCTATSDTGIVHSFPVRPAYVNYQTLKKNHSVDLDENVVTNRGAEGLCQVVVSNVQDTGPKEWDLEAKDFDNAVVVKTNFTVEFFYKGPLLKYEIRVMEFSSFVNYMVMPDDSDLDSCYVNMNNTLKIDLDMHTPRTNTFLSPYAANIEELSKRVSSLGHGYCGFKFINATEELKTMDWSLTAIDNKKVSYRGLFVTRIDDKPSDENLHSVRNVLIGKEFEVTCLGPVVSPFCSIFNPDGHLVEAEKCKYTITSFTIEHVGVWKCLNGFGTSMESLEYTIELHAVFPEKIIQWTNETEDYVNIGCAVSNYRGRTVNYCKMVAPNEQIFNVMPFFATERYLTLGTDFLKAVCSMMIRKPLQEFEKGLWRCEIKLEYYTVTGSYIMVGSATPPVYPKYYRISTKKGKPFTVTCNVPYHSKYCRIKAPNGTVFVPDNVREVGLGRCAMHVEVSNTTHNGTWTCSYGRQTGTPDDVIRVDVVIAESLSYYRVVEVDVGDSAELMCSTAGLPILYCRFVSPKNVGYFIGNHENNPSGISYYGRGFEYGECGIRIPKVEVSDNGYWTCETQLVIEADPGTSPEKNVLMANIFLDVESSLLSGPNIAAIGIGTAVGIVIVTVIFGIMFKQKWNRRRHTEVEGTVNPNQRRNSNDSSQNSGSNIFNMDEPPRPYRNPQASTRHNNEDEQVNISLEEMPHSSNNPGPSRNSNSSNEESMH